MKLVGALLTATSGYSGGGHCALGQTFAPGVNQSGVLPAGIDVKTVSVCSKDAMGCAAESCDGRRQTI